MLCKINQRKRYLVMKKLTVHLIICLTFVMAISGAAIAQEPKSGSAGSIQKTADEQQFDDLCAKAASEVKASREAIANLMRAREIDNQIINQQKTLIDTYDRLAQSKDAEIQALREMNKILQKRSERKISFLFGLVKIRY